MTATRKIYFFSIIVMIGCLFSCRKSEQLKVKIVNAVTTQDILSIQLVNDRVLYSGGNKGETGLLGELSNDLVKNELLVDTLEYPIYDVTFVNQRYVLVGEEIAIYYSDSLQRYVSHWFIPQYWVQNKYKKALRNIAVADNGNTLLAGGGNINIGVQFNSYDSTHFEPMVSDNEWRFVTCYKNHAWIGGFGALKYSSDYGRNWEYRDVEGYYFTSAIFYNQNEGVLSDFHGRIVKTKDGGKSFTTVYKNKGFTGDVVLNKIISNEFNPSVLVGVGSENKLFYSADKGDSWERYKIDLDSPINDGLFVSTSELVVVGDNGLIATIELP